MRWPYQRSLKSTILWLFIPMILLIVPITGIVSYSLAAEQLKTNAETGIRDTVSQTRNFLNDRLTALLTDMTELDRNSDIRSIFNRADQPNFSLKPMDYVLLSKNLDKVYSDFYSIIDSIFVYDDGGRVSMYLNDYMKRDVPFSIQPYLARPFATNSQVYWLNASPNTFSSSTGDKVAGLYKWIGGKHGERSGIILFQVKEKFFRSMLTAPKISTNGYLLLASPDGMMSFKTTSGKYAIDENWLRNELMKAESASGKIEFENADHKKMTVLYDTIGINKWKIAAVYPQEEIYRKVNYIKYVNLSVMVAVIILAVMLSSLLANIISKPLHVLTRKINSIEQGNLNVVLIDRPNNEIGILNKGIKDMLERIKQLLSQVEHVQEQKRLAELSALQAQIQPHFLYNTLYSIKQLSEMGETEDASQMITALSNYFRISISKGSEIIPVSSEIEHIKQYLYIQQMRYGDQFSYEIDVDATMLTCRIIKLTLQPLVENAIYHGVKKVRRPCLIRISGWCEDSICYFQVQDNGAGMSSDRLIELNNSLSEESDEQQGIGFGVRNVHRRLQLHYGSEFGLSYESILGEGTIVTVKFRNEPEPDMI